MRRCLKCRVDTPNLRCARCWQETVEGPRKQKSHRRGRGQSHKDTYLPPEHCISSDLVAIQSRHRTQIRFAEDDDESSIPGGHPGGTLPDKG